MKACPSGAQDVDGWVVPALPPLDRLLQDRTGSAPGACCRVGHRKFVRSSVRLSVRPSVRPLTALT